MSATAASTAHATPAPAGFYRFSVGGIDAVALSDGQEALGPIGPILAPDAEPDELERVLAADFRRQDAAPVQFNVLLLHAGSDVVLVDAGWGGAPGGRLTANMAAAGVAPDDVSLVIVTHAHPDHVGGLLDAAGAPAFPRARHLVNRTEHDYWSDPRCDMTGARMPDRMRSEWIGTARRVLEGVRRRLELVEPGDRLLGGAIELIEAPGHTPGHMPLIVRDAGEELVVMMDLAHDPVIYFSRPDWVTSFDLDRAASEASRRRIWDRVVAEGSRTFGYHMPWPGLGHIRRRGDGYEWVPEQWIW